MVFQKEEVIRFRHCDPAGIVFYPRYLEILNDTVEDWFQAMGFAFRDMQARFGAGVPTVNLNITFSKPCRQSDRLTLLLSCLRVGDSSFEVRISGWHEGEAILEAQLVLCFSAIGERVGKMSIPPQIRQQLLQYVPAPAAVPTPAG
ncbi:acyl-CoA thioesterase [Marinobacterium rhizophilum]|uniref:Acyl-CoA thioesterase n=1 Tax=Marinobacterium rhizophilum TaxID=420402 RepID=A0ABY5HQB8_9GAMM|nr:thioesterase family protein [Marinobacterium rhizophilum]UTW14174.1 acyl-CoA thioesterase [Marinobacterium rhizophilum]